jgi:hypothetical protein
VLQCPPDAIGDLLRRLDMHIGQVDAADHDLLPRQLLQHRGIQVRLGGLDRNLPHRRAGELRQERVARRALVDDRGIAEADVHRRRAADSFQCTIERAQPVLARLLRPRLHIRLVDLHHIGAGGEELAYLLIHGDRVVHRRCFVRAVILVLRLLQHGERTRHGDLGLARGMALQETQVVELHRVLAPDLADDARHGVRMA